jgi:serine/threonine protein kinase
MASIIMESTDGDGNVDTEMVKQSAQDLMNRIDGNVYAGGEKIVVDFGGDSNTVYSLLFQPGRSNPVNTPVVYHESDQPGKTDYLDLAMEFEGPNGQKVRCSESRKYRMDLLDAIIEGRLPPELNSIVMHKILECCDVLHRKYKIGHRDIKPENIFLSIEGNEVRLVVGDFGLATRLTCGSGTRASEASGSPNWALDSQFGADYNVVQNDIYLIAGVIYAMLTGSGLPPLHVRSESNAWVWDSIDGRESCQNWPHLWHEVSRGALPTQNASDRPTIAEMAAALDKDKQ